MLEAGTTSKYYCSFRSLIDILDVSPPRGFLLSLVTTCDCFISLKLSAELLMLAAMF